MASIGRLLSEIEKGLTDEQIRQNSADVFFIDFVADVVRVTWTPHALALGVIGSIGSSPTPTPQQCEPLHSFNPTNKES